MNSGKTTLYCSFCGKSQHEVYKLIAGPTVFICDECTLLCFEIVVYEPNAERFAKMIENLDQDLLKNTGFETVEEFLAKAGLDGTSGPYPGRIILSGMMIALSSCYTKHDHDVIRRQSLMQDLRSRIAAGEREVKDKLAPLREELARLESGGPLPEESTDPPKIRS